MSSSSSTVISNVYTSRKNILDQLKKRGFDISNYEGFSINDINIMFDKEQLDMLIENDKGHKVYIKYHITKKINPNHIYTISTDLYDMHNILNKETDEIIFITNDDPNDSINKTTTQIYYTENMFITVINIKRLLFNILEHSQVPPHRILNDEERTDLYKKYNIINDTEQLPTISRFDPVAKAIGMRPGQVCEIIRPSKTAIQSKYYRLCN